MLSDVSEFVIQGITDSGELFQQEGWATNLCNMLGTSGSDRRQVFSSYARALVIDGVSCVVVCASLKHVDPKAFEMVRRFVADNHLKIRSGRGGRDAEDPAETGPHPVPDVERRKTEPDGC